MNPFALGPGFKYILLGVVLLLAVVVFARVRSDYVRLRRLSAPVAVLQTGYFCVYALSSYAFLNSRLSQVQLGYPLTWFAVVLMAIGLALVLLSMPFLGRTSFGEHVGKLRTTGLYRFTRNPQLLGFLPLVLGYALLWPSIHGILWAAVAIPIAHLMVQCEEEHLLDVFGEEYRAYCAKTPRFLGLPRPPR